MALPFSDTDKAKYMTGQYLKEIKLTFPQLNLTILNDEIYSESLSLEEAIFDGNAELSIVGCISNRFGIEIRNQGVQLKNKKIQVDIRIDGGSWNRIYEGYVDSVETVRDRSYQKLSCYDALYKWQDKNYFDTYAALNFPVTIKTLRDSVFSFIGVTQETITLVNDDITVEQTVEDGELAVIDVIRAICQINGVFGRVCADGKFHYIDLEMPSEFLPFPSDDNFPADDNYPAEPVMETQYIDKYKTISYEDYTLAQITGVTVRDGTSDVNYATAGDDDNVLLIEGNMLLNGAAKATKETVAENILDKVQYAVYQPFSAESVGLPFVEVGDAVAYYVFDYSSGQPETEIMGFTVMKRSLRGIQWMTDTYDATGNEYQPEAQPVGQDDVAQELSQMEQEIADLANDVENIGNELANKQNFIDVDLLPPSGTANEGDLLFYGNMPARLYRYENGAWLKKEWIAYGNTAPMVTPVEGDIFFENDSANITSIKQYIGGVWIDYTTGYGHLVDYLTSEQNTEVKYLDGANIFQRSFYLNDGVSLVPDTWTNVIQSNVIGEVIRAEAKNGNGDMIAVIGRVNSGYVQFMSLMNANQTLKVLTLQYIKKAGSYEFNENYENGKTYTFAPTIDSEEFFVWVVRHFIGIARQHTGWNNAPIWSYVLTNLSSIVERFMQYKGNNHGIGVLCAANDNYGEVRMNIYVSFTNGNKSARVEESATEYGDESKEVWGNESQWSLWATRGEYYVELFPNHEPYWHTPEWAYTMYCRHIGVQWSGDGQCFASNYGIHLL